MWLDWSREEFPTTPYDTNTKRLLLLSCEQVSMTLQHSSSQFVVMAWLKVSWAQVSPLGQSIPCSMKHPTMERSELA
jgi:hypothetical protein